MNVKPTIAIIGAGKVGTALGALAAQAGYPVAAVVARSSLHARQAAERIARSAGRPAGTGPHVTDAPAAARSADLVLLTVPDDDIATVARELARAHALEHAPILAHCAGALASDVLREAAGKGAVEVGSMHPLQTFPTADAAMAHMRGSYFFIEGDGRAVQTLSDLAIAMGGVPIEIDAADKPLYHAAAAVACNYLTAIMDAAIAMLTKTGVPITVARAALLALARATLENVAAMGTEDALTGPVARGDAATIRRHIEALGRLGPQFRMLYAALGGYTVELALRKGTLDADKARAIWRMLLEATPDANDVDG